VANGGNHRGEMAARHKELQMEIERYEIREHVANENGAHNTGK